LILFSFLSFISYSQLLLTFHIQVKALAEDCSNKKASVDSLKQRLNVATKEKSQYEQMYHKAKDELEKKVYYSCDGSTVEPFRTSLSKEKLQGHQLRLLKYRMGKYPRIIVVCFSDLIQSHH